LPSASEGGVLTGSALFRKRGIMTFNEVMASIVTMYVLALALLAMIKHKNRFHLLIGDLVCFQIVLTVSIWLSVLVMNR
jgi:hypothetical protein